MEPLPSAPSPPTTGGFAAPPSTAPTSTGLNTRGPNKRCSGPPAADAGRKSGVPTGIRTLVAAVKGRCPGPLDDGDGGATGVPNPVVSVTDRRLLAQPPPWRWCSPI